MEYSHNFDKISLKQEDKCLTKTEHILIVTIPICFHRNTVFIKPFTIVIIGKWIRALITNNNPPPPTKNCGKTINNIIKIIKPIKSLTVSLFIAAITLKLRMILQKLEGERK